MSDEITYMVRGQPLTMRQVEATAEKAKPKPKSEGPDAFHKGFRAEGYPPGFVVAAEAAANAAIIQWNQADDSYRNGRKAPQMWNFNTWSNRVKRKPIEKPFASEESAETAKALAERAGWTHVQVVALKREGQQK